MMGMNTTLILLEHLKVLDWLKVSMVLDILTDLLESLTKMATILFQEILVENGYSKINLQAKTKTVHLEVRVRSVQEKVRF